MIKMNRQYTKIYYQNSFRLQCLDVDPLTMDQFDRSVTNAREIVKDPRFAKIKKVIGTGCGDSNLVAPAVKEAFNKYLPNVQFLGMQALELSRYYDYADEEGSTMIVAASVSGSVVITNETLKRGNKHNYLTVAMTDNKESDCAKSGAVLYHTNSPKGDNNAGLRTYFVNCLSLIILAAAMAEVRDNKDYLTELRAEMQEYHDEFFKDYDAVDTQMFDLALRWRGKKFYEAIADGPLLASAKFIGAKFAEVPGIEMAVIDSEDYNHVNQMMGPGDYYGEVILINSNDKNVDRIVATTNNVIANAKREVILFSDKTPEELGIVGECKYCHIAVAKKEFNFLTPLYAYLPACILAGFVSTTTGHPFFNGGFNKYIMKYTYRPVEEILD